MLKEINQLYTSLKAVQAAKKGLEEQLKEVTSQELSLSRSLGDMLAGNGMQSLTMADGKSVELKTSYRCSIAQERIDQIREVLEQQGASDILKPQKINIDKKEVDTLPEELRSRIHYSIAPNTLKAHLKELAENNQLDDKTIETFKVFIDHSVKVG